MKIASSSSSNPLTLHELEQLKEDIEATSSQAAVTALFKQSFDGIKAIFDNHSLPAPKSAIISNKALFSQCFKCLSTFITHSSPKISTRSSTKENVFENNDKFVITLHKSSTKKLFKSFISEMLRIETILSEYKGEREDDSIISTTISLFKMVVIFVKNFKQLRPPSFHMSIYPQVLSPLLSRILCIGESITFEDEFVKDILGTCIPIAYTTKDSTKNSLLLLIRPHISPWMKKYPAKKCFTHWITILKYLTLDKDNIHPHKDRSSQLWFIFHPILDIVKDISFKDYHFDDSAIFRFLSLFTHLWCVPTHILDVYENIKARLAEWFELIIEQSNLKEKKEGIKSWSKLISTLSSSPSLSSYLSPKYDSTMEWCSQNGGLSEDYDRFLSNSHPYPKKWIKLIRSIKICQDYSSLLEMYHELKDEMLQVFISSLLNQKVQENKIEIRLLNGWFKVFKRRKYGTGLKFWSELIYMFSTVPKLIPHLSPKFDINMEYIAENNPLISDYFSKYISNIFVFLSSSYFSVLTHSIPIISIIPSFEIYRLPDSTDLLTTHVCSGVELKQILKDETPKISYYCAILGIEMKCKCIFHGKFCKIDIKELDPEISPSSLPISHSSVIQYTPPQHLLVTMQFSEERSFRQYMYNFIERTGAGVEVLFDEEILSYEWYNQDEQE
ncbi:hypothetical protein ADUPG1_008501 [Aduncisulcus paluster]|uniref:Uncharacterized protein n=1 Tax=Aduncisulcus paluster TaxID=2918883 RepID=A0ABQ5KV50_9EUKA|nr:hypothetical protein ADUPG1_008501 [Aduncisulcus paluster]